MGKRGPRPKPAGVRRREGNPAQHKIVETTPTAGEPVRPAGLQGDAAALWDDLVAKLIAARVVGELDSPALEAMCVQWDVMQGARRALEQDGYVALGSTGQVVEHPMVQTLARATTLFLRYAAEFGCTPAARMRVEKPEAKPTSFADGIGASPRLALVE